MIRDEIDHGRSFLFVPVWIGLGCLIWFHGAFDLPVAILAGGFVLLAALGWKLHYTPGFQARLPAIGALILCGALLAETESWRRQTILLDSAVTTTMTGRIDRRETTGKNRWRYLLHVTRTENPRLKRPPSRLLVTLRGASKPFEIGTILRGRVRLSPPSGPALPGLNNFGFGAYFDGIGAYGFFLGRPDIVTNAEPATRSYIQSIEVWLFDIRGRIGDRIRRIVTGDAGAFAAALVTDERRAISQQTTEALRLSGLAHIIAISGLNMALAAGIFFVGVRSLLSLSVGMAQRYPIKKIAAAGALLMTCAYYLISGFAVSAERAFLMMAIVLIAAILDRPSISLHNIALSAIVIMVLTPSEIVGPSFQMSFAATLALVAGFNLWQDGSPARSATDNPRSNLGSTAGRFVGGIAITSLIGSLSTAVFSIEHFHKLATYGLLANLAAMPVISFIVMPAGLIGMLLMPFGLDPLPLKVMGWGLEIVIVIARHVASWGGQVTFGRQPALFLPLSVIGILLLLLLQTRLRYIGLAFLLAAFGLQVSRNDITPDILVSEDGRLVALTDSKLLNTNRSKPSRFIFQQWQNALAIQDYRPPLQPGPSPPAARATGSSRKERLGERQLTEAAAQLKTALAGAPDRRFFCLPKSWCAAKTSIGTIIALEDGRYVGFACDHARLVITPTRSKVTRCRSGALVLDGETLRHTGAMEIYFTGNTSRPFRITPSFRNSHRPWTIHRSYSWRDDAYSARLDSEISSLINDNDE